VFHAEFQRHLGLSGLQLVHFDCRVRLGCRLRLVRFAGRLHRFGCRHAAFRLRRHDRR
jgi:hypothetical protein